MNTEFSAGPQALGYYYQVRHALYLILENREEAELSIESLDDVVFEEGGSSVELIQVKHHIDRKASLTDNSADLWKTIRVWSTNLNEKRILFPDILLTLVTTAKAPDGSIASLLRPDPDPNRDSKSANRRLIDIATNSNNESLKQAFEAFMILSSRQREELVDSIQVLDISPNISDTANKIKEKILGVRREHLDGLYERLDGWWFEKVIYHLSGKSRDTITRYEVYDKIVEITEQFHPDALPIDFLDAEPPTSLDSEGANRRFVHQLSIIMVKNRRIEKAIMDYYRAFEQRSRWVREDLLIGDELEKYEKKLVDEWDRHFLALEDEFSIDGAREEELQKFGRQIYKWADVEADIRIRHQVTEKYVMRGSYHILADQDPPRVWWHPKFIGRLETLLTVKEES